MVYVLWLNDMRASNIENLQPVAWAESSECIEGLLRRERVDGYRDGQWGKSFRKDGPLEWFNPPSEPGGGLVGGIRQHSELEVRDGVLYRPAVPILDLPSVTMLGGA